jgi:hypothetical protein
MMEDQKPSPIEPLEYARSTPALVRVARMMPGKRGRRIVRLIYLLICSVGLFFAIRFLLHYRQMIEDAMNAKK